METTLCMKQYYKILITIPVLFILQYADKSFFYKHEGMIVRAALTAIDNNKNVSRSQVIPTTSSCVMLVPLLTF
jgi:hypothetical protein